MGSMLALLAKLIKLILLLVTDGDLFWNLSVTIVAAAARAFKVGALTKAAGTDIIIMLMADAH